MEMEANQNVQYRWNIIEIVFENGFFFASSVFIKHRSFNRLSKRVPSRFPIFQPFHQLIRFKSYIFHGNNRGPCNTGLLIVIWQADWIQIKPYEGTVVRRRGERSRVAILRCKKGPRIWNVIDGREGMGAPTGISSGPPFPSIRIRCNGKYTHWKSYSITTTTITITKIPLVEEHKHFRQYFIQMDLSACVCVCAC